MSENQNRGIYDSMTTEALEEILRLDAEMPAGQDSDTDKILEIMEVLAERKRNTGHTGKTALEAYESFKQHYMPETNSHTVPAKRKSSCPRWVRRLTATAAVLAILITGSVTAKAFGFNLWKAVIQWTQETFHFGNWNGSDVNNNLQFDTLRDALEQGNVPVSLVPTWIPDGYEVSDITEERTPMKKTYRAKYTNNEKTFRITIQDYLDAGPLYVEQIEGLIEKYEVSGTIYYIFKDIDLIKVKWITDSYECSISGNVTIEELKMMIDSIEKG